MGMMGHQESQDVMVMMEETEQTGVSLIWAYTFEGREIFFFLYRTRSTRR